MKVLFLPEIRNYFDELETVLYEKEYFSYEENAHKYVAELFNDIATNLPIHSNKPAPKFFEKFGKNMHYATFRKSKQTTWYVFFTIYNENGNTVYLVRYIANNHSVAQYL